MRRACLVAVSALSLLLWGALPLRAEELWVPRAVTISLPDELVRPPVLAVRPDGQAAMAVFARAGGNGAAHVHLARSPSWQFAPIGLLSEGSADDELLVRADGELTTAWSRVGSQGRTWERVRGGVLESIEPTAPESATYALAPDGSLVAIWAAQEALHLWREGSSLTQTTHLPSGQTPVGFQLAVDDQGALHVAFEGRDEASETPSIFYLRFSADAPNAEPVEIAPQGQAPLLAVGPDGRAHLAWWQADALYYADGPAWQARLALAATNPRPQAVALAAGPDGGAYLVWLQGQELDWAHTLDLQRTRTSYPIIGEVATLCAAVDGRGRLHIAWATQDATSVSYLAPWPDVAQVAVTYPLEDALLTADARAIVQTNLPLGEVERVEFYLEPWDESPVASASALLSLGVDTVPADGWSASLSRAGLESGRRYRVVAWAVRRTGELLPTSGGWFRVQPPGAPAVWSQVGANPAASEAGLWISSPSEQESPLVASIHLQPVSPSSCAQPSGCLPAPDASPQYLQSVIIDSADIKPILLDTTSWQPGAYQAQLHMTDEAGAEHWITARRPLVVERVPGLQVQVTAPTQAVVTGRRVELAASVMAPHSTVVRVDFWLSRADVLDASDEHSPAELIWAGSDDEGQDGWSLHLAVDPFWLGGAWRAWVVAHDVAGNTATARSQQPFILLGERPEISLETPAPGDPLAGVQEFAVRVENGQPGVTGILAYLTNGSRITQVGALVAVEGVWRLAWDTRAVADGAYRTLLVASLADGHRALIVSDPVRIANAVSGYRFLSPTAPKVWQEEVWLTVQGPQAEARGLTRFFLQDGDGRLHPVAEGAPQGAQWAALWNTRAYLDGDYTLVALAPGGDGRWVRLEQAVQVRNELPQITFEGDRAVWNGLERVSWQMVHPGGQPLTMTVEYSPDGGGHWLRLARADPDQQAILWDTRDVPDTTQGLLRLTGCNEVRCGRALSKPISVRNHNQPPELALLAPDEKETRLGRGVQVAWQAVDPEGGPVTVTVSFRSLDGLWQTLAEGQPATGAMTWDTRNLPTGEGYALRVAAVDDARARSERILDERILTGQSAPTIRLVWPNGNIRLEDEVAILWHAADRDGDQLTVDLYYSDNNGQAWLPLAEGLENTGYYVWQVAFLPPGVQYRLRAVARDGLFQAVDESEGSFVVGDESALQVALTSPRTQDAVAGWQLVRWEVTDAEHRDLTADLGVRAVGESVWRPIAVNTPNDGFWLWDASPLPEGDYLLRVMVSDERTNTSTSASVTVHVANDSNPAPGVSLLQPQGGEHWDGWRAVTWEVRDTNRLLTATLTLSLDGGMTWQELAQVDARSGGYLWDTRSLAPSRRCLLRLAVTDGKTTGFDQTDGIFALVNRDSLPPYIGLLQFQGSPDAGAVARWLAEDSDGDPLRIRLATSSDRGATWQERSLGVVDLGEFVLANKLAAGAQALRLVADDGLYRVQASRAVAASASSLASPPQLKLIAPSVGETWSGEGLVRWQASDPLGQGLTIAVAWSADGGLTWTSLAHNLPNSGELPWNTLDAPNGEYRLRLMASDGLRTQTVMSAPVTIYNPGRSAPSIALLTPNADQMWAGLQEVRWSTLDADHDRLTVALEYSLDRGRTWSQFAESLPDTGGYVWDTTLSPNCREVWLAATVSDGQFSTRRVGAFPVEVRNPLAPQVLLLVDPSAGPWQGVRRIAWRTDYSGLRRVQVGIDLSLDGGQSWQALARDLGLRGSIIWDTRTIAERSAVLLRATASDGVAKGIDLLDQPLVILGNASPGQAEPWYAR